MCILAIETGVLSDYDLVNEKFIIHYSTDKKEVNMFAVKFSNEQVAQHILHELRFFSNIPFFIKQIPD